MDFRKKRTGKIDWVNVAIVAAEAFQLFVLGAVITAGIWLALKHW